MIGVMRKVIRNGRIPRAWVYPTLIVAVAWLLVVSALSINEEKASFDIKSQDIRADSGCAYVTILNHTPKYRRFLEYTPDTLADKSASTLVLKENGAPIGTPHVLHDLIRSKGEGRYSHWYIGLFFSTPDCSDPRSNGRHYSIEVTPSPRLWVKVSILAALLLVHFALLSRFGERLFYLRWFSVARNLVISVLTPNYVASISGWRPIGLAIVIWISALACLAKSWLAGTAFDLSIGSAYQFSDASGYWICANAILNHHMAAAFNWYEWCLRRPIYPTLLAGMLRFSDQNIHETLIIQAAFLSLAIGILINRVAGLCGLLGGALTLALLVYYSTYDAFGLTMTENAGLIFGSLALAFLLIACQKKSLPWTCAGLALLSIALNARAGAFFVLPLLLAWVALIARAWQKSVLRWLLAAGIALMAGFALQVLLVVLNGGPASGGHGAFAYTLYGLSVGGLGWDQVLKDHPYLTTLGSDKAMSQEIYRLAVASINNHPRLFFTGLYKGWLLFVNEGTYGYQRLQSLAPVLNAFWWIGGGFLVYRWRDPRYLLLLAFAGGTVLSAPWLRADGGPRVFAATIAADAIQISIGITCLSMLLLVGIAKFRKHSTNLEQIRSPAWVPNHVIEFTVVGLLGGLLIACLLPAPASAPPISNDAFTCAKGDYSVVTTLGYNGTYLLDLVGDGTKPDPLKGEVLRTKLLRAIPADAWWWTPPPPETVRSLVTVYPERVTESPELAGSNIYSEKHLAKYFGQKVGLCFSGKDIVTVFGNPYRKLTSIDVLQPKKRP